MLRNYLLTSWRNILRHKLFSFINIMGLAIGMVACMMISLYVQDELSYDRHFPNYEKIYRVCLERIYPTHTTFWAPLPPAAIPTIRENLPKVEAATMFSQSSTSVKIENQIFESEPNIVVDSSFFKVFELEVLEGDPHQSLKDPSNVVLTQKAVKRYFGDENPMGKTIYIRDSIPMKVGAIIADLPRQTHFEFDFIRSFNPRRDLSIWGSAFAYYSYVKLQDNYSPEHFQEDFQPIANAHMLTEFDSETAFEEWLETGNAYIFFPQPIKDIHLTSDFNWEFQSNGDISYIYLFSIIALFIMLIACINFMNLATARSSQRAREIGIRKVLGSQVKHIVTQFMLESVLMAVLAAFVALQISHVLLPSFETLIGKDFEQTFFLQWPQLWKIGLFTLIIGLLAGVYPAFYLSAFRPIQVLKGQLAIWNSQQLQKTSGARNALVVLQFSISMILIVGTLMVYQQLRFIQDQKLGFDKEQVAIVKYADLLGNQIYAFKDQLELLKGVDAVSQTSFMPGSMGGASSFAPKSSSENELVNMAMLWADDAWINVLGINLLEGRNFMDSEMRPPRKGVPIPAIINQRAAKEMGLGDSALNSLLIDHRKTVYEVVGIVEDFHLESLHHEVKPFIYVLGNWGNKLAIRLNHTNVKQSLKEIESLWATFVPGRNFHYEFLDENIQELYAQEETTGHLAIIFSGLAIWVACLGLFGLVTFFAERRKKEIGIRKVLGASVQQIIVLLTSRYLWLIAVAFVISCPLAFLGAKQWLQNFAYKAPVQWWMFALACLLTLGIALFTIGVKAYYSAQSNPVDALRHER